MGALFGSGPVVRHNFRWDMVASVGAGLFTVFTLNFVTVVARRAEADALTISAILAAPFAGSMLAIFSNYILPRRNRQAFATWAIVAGRGLLLLALFSTAPLALTGMALGHWIIISLVTPVLFEVLRDIYPPSQRGRLLSYTRLGLTGSMTLGSLAAGLMLDLLGPHLLLPLGALFGIGGALAWGRIVSENEETSPPQGLGHTFRILREDRRFRVYTLSLAAWGFGLLLPGPLYPIMLVDRFNASYSEIGIMGFVSSAVWLLGYLFWSRSIDRWDPVRVIALSFALCMLLPICYLLGPSVWFLLPGVAAQGFGSAGLDLGGINVLMRLAPRSRMPDYASLLTSIAGVRGLVAPFLSPLLAAAPWFGAGGVLALATVLMLIGSVSVLRTAGGLEADEAPLPVSVASDGSAA